MRSFKENARALIFFALACSVVIAGAGLSLVPSLVTVGAIVFFAGLLFLVIVGIIYWPII
jgi:hypothetical protein